MNLSTKSQIRIVQVVTKSRDTSVTELCQELNITRATLSRHVRPTGENREGGVKLLNA